MNNYYFTFGINQPLQNYFQQIVAENMVQAEKKMFEEWGAKWGFGYTQEEFTEAVKKGHLINLKPLEPLYVTKLITFGEMKGFTDKLNQIITTDRVNKDERLRNLASVLDNVYSKNDKYAQEMLFTTLEHMSI